MHKVPKSRWKLGEMSGSQCSNMVHPSCGKKIAETFKKGECDFSLVREASNNTRSHSQVLQWEVEYGQRET